TRQLPRPFSWSDPRPETIRANPSSSDDPLLPNSNPFRTVRLPLFEQSLRFAGFVLGSLDIATVPVRSASIRHCRGSPIELKIGNVRGVGSHGVPDNSFQCCVSDCHEVLMLKGKQMIECRSSPGLIASERIEQSELQ